MANPKKRRKIIVLCSIALVVAGLGTVAIFKKREPVVTVQTEKVARRTLTEIVSANGKIQPVVQVKISPEVSGEIIELPLKEGQCVQKGDRIVRIKPDFYIAQRNQAEAGYKSSVASKATAEANLRKAEAEFRRNQDLYRIKLISDSVFDEVLASYDVAKAQLTNSEHQVEMSHASLASAEDALDKTTIVSPLTGTISKLNSEVGERVLGTVQNIGTEIMTVADLNEMEARVDIGETDIVLISPGQSVRLEVDAFKDRKFSGVVTEIANSSKGAALSSSGMGGATSQEATKFEVKIRIKEKTSFRPGMSVTAEIETRYRTNVLAVPIASVTTRLPKEKGKTAEGKTVALDDPPATPSLTARAKSGDGQTNAAVAGTNAPGVEGTNAAKADKKAAKPIEVVFLVEGGRAKMVPVRIGVSDDNYWEVTEGLQEGQEVVSGGFRAISRDLDDGKRIKKGPPPTEREKEKNEEASKPD
jgi:HlyD family secretion protein